MSNELFLDRSILLTALNRLAELAEEAEKIVEIAIYGGSAIALVWDNRRATRDVDAVIAGDREFVRTIARQVAEEFNWPEDWLNDAIKGFVSSQGELELLAELPDSQNVHLRIFTPSAEYLLAMKCMAMRIALDGHDDLEDIRMLIRETGVRSAEDIFAIVEKFYPHNRIPSKVVFGIEEIMEQLAILT